ncbi:aldo/keto reductase [Aeromicrobium sp.]|uniref:aldo/keto reductase n=1 Tax=Aeromicrobium sp. TaxID=1871063 RepID=UPI003D6C27AA
MTTPTLDLNNGVSIPQLGFGVFQVPPKDTADIVTQALDVGYRHIDTALAYHNEQGVGEAIASSSLSRDDVFVTTKLWNYDQGTDAAFKAFDASLERLGFDVLDLYLIHWPAPQQDRYVDTWKAFEQLYADGRIRAIGVSNFRVEDLQRLLDLGLTVPVVNQIELHPYLTQDELRIFHDKHEIVTEAWSPIAQGAVLDDPVITELARAKDATPAQVVIAWHLALGNVVIPKSVTPDRIAENFASTEVELAGDEIDAISALNRNERTGPDPWEFPG